METWYHRPTFRLCPPPPTTPSGYSESIGLYLSLNPFITAKPRPETRTYPNVTANSASLLCRQNDDFQLPNTTSELAIIFGRPIQTLGIKTLVIPFPQKGNGILFLFGFILAIIIIRAVVVVVVKVGQISLFF